MAEIYLIAIVGVLLCVLIRGLASPLRMYEYPYFMSAVFAAFVAPQAISLIRFPLGATPRSIDAVLLMTLLCLLACLIGYRAAPARWILKSVDVPVDDRKLFHWGVLFTCCGLFFTYLIGAMTSSERGGNLWSGKVTIYLFFASLAHPGLSICLREALMRGGSTAWLWALMGAWIPVVSGLVYGRREPTVLFVLTIALTLFYCRRKVVPRWAMILGIVVAAVGIPATTQYRMAAGTRGTAAAITEIDFVGNFNRFISNPAVLELRNAAMMIETTTRTGKYDLGRGYWDELVFRFVPAQVLGKDFKHGLMFSPADKERQEQEFAVLGYKATGGTTLTGMGDSFREFGYAGAIVFAVMAVIFKSLWQASLKRDAVFPQLLYIQTCTSAMLAITHQTVNYLPGLIYNLVFIGAAILYSRKHVTPIAAPQGAPSVR